MKKKKLLKALKNIKGKNEKQLEAIEYQEKRQLHAIKNYSTKEELFKELEFSSEKSEKAKEIFVKIKDADEEVDYDNLVCAHSDGKTIYDFNKFKSLEEFMNDVYLRPISIKYAKDRQNKMNKLMIDLKNYSPTNKDKIRSRSGVLDKTQKCFIMEEI